MGVFNELKSRGLIAQTTNEEKIKELLENDKVTFYIGFDPTADSLHVGHFLQLIVMSHMQKAGHRPIAILGGGTAMIGDPTGKTDMRKILTRDEIAHNADCFKKQMSRLVDFSDGKALMIDNGDWLLNLNYIQFLREIGVHFSVNRMLTYESYKTRLERGLSFIEFNYTLMQSYDFLKLYQDYNCNLQLGGDDQWSNIIGGIELIRRVEGSEAYGMTFTLLTTSTGKKMGKTENGAVWLDPEKTSPYEFYQYWRNIDDADVIRCLKMLTFLPLDYIDELAILKDSEINKAKEILAFEITKLVHGEEEAQKAQNTAKALFSGSADESSIPTNNIGKDSFKDNSISILDLIVLTGIAPSKGEARRLVDQGGIFINDEKVESAQKLISYDEIKSKRFILKKGKKTFIKITVD